MPFVDFEQVKKDTTFEKAISLLGLEMKKAGSQFRGPCPRCKSGGERALVITPLKGFYCFSQQGGGDVIALVAHIKDCSVKEAAQFLVNGTGTSKSTGTSRQVTVPEGATAKEGTKTFPPLTYLESDHDAVHAVGFSPEFAAKHGIGFANKGILRGTVAIPFRDEHGNLLGYLGATELKLPADFTPNVINFGKKSA